MNLDLDKRQRAMLREMGVRVWQPVAPTAPFAALTDPEVATNSIASHAHPSAVSSTFHSNNQRPETTPPGRPAQAWRLGEARALYAGATQVDGVRWLVLAEAQHGVQVAPGADPFMGDAGKLLDNMLRAVRLNQTGTVLLATLSRDGRQATAGSDDAGVQPDLSALVALARPDLVLVMGRLPAQAVLDTGEPLGKLRGQVHDLHGTSAVVTYDLPYLLRNPLDKAKAWDDLCLALNVLPQSSYNNP